MLLHLKSYLYPVLSMWLRWLSEGGHLCKGKMVNSVCNFNVADLAGIAASPCITANKFNLEVDAWAALLHSGNVLRQLMPH